MPADNSSAKLISALLPPVRKPSIILKSGVMARCSFVVEILLPFDCCPLFALRHDGDI
jgi:hypothetical protein